MNQDMNSYPYRQGAYPQSGAPDPRTQGSSNKSGLPFEDVPENSYSAKNEQNYQAGAQRRDYPQANKGQAPRFDTFGYNPYPEQQNPGQSEYFQQGREYARRPESYAAPNSERRADAQGRQRMGNRPYGAAGYNTAMKHDFTKILGEFGSVFNSFFSKNPAKVLTHNLSSITWISLLVVNVLFFALAKATFTAKFGDLAALGDLGAALSSLGSLMGGDMSGPNWGASFGLALLRQAAVLLIYFACTWIFTSLGGEAKMSAVQYIKLVSYPTLLHSLISFTIIFISLFATGFAGVLMSFNKYLLFLSYVYFMDSAFEKNRSKRYWVYVVLIFIINFVA